MTYDEAKAKADTLYALMKDAASVLGQFPTGAMGLTPDDVKASAAFRAAKSAYDQAHANVQEFNLFFTRTFKAEIKQARAQRIAEGERMFLAARTAVADLRATWTKKGVPTDQQAALLDAIKAKAAPGAQVGPFTIQDRG